MEVAEDNTLQGNLGLVGTAGAPQCQTKNGEKQSKTRYKEQDMRTTGPDLSAAGFIVPERFLCYGIGLRPLSSAVTFVGDDLAPKMGARGSPRVAP